MSEEIINYSGGKELNWLQRKRKGFLNRYFKYKRLMAWAIHIRRHKIEPDYSKISKGSIPVIINNFNRLDLLVKQVEWLRSLEDNISILIVDNDSNYPPLLDYYKQLDHPSIQVVLLNFNSWRKGAEHIGNQLLERFEHIVITDSDLLPFEDTPKDLFSHLRSLMIQFPKFNHIGTSLRIDDLPDHNPMKSTIVDYEQIFWPPNAIEVEDKGYEAKIDTTFAMYKKNSKLLLTEPAMRTAPPYMLKHVDWYLDPNHYNQEFQFYFDSCKSFATWAHERKRQDSNDELLPMDSVSEEI